MEKIHFIDISAIIYLTKRLVSLVSHESAEFHSEMLIKCPDTNMPGGRMEIIVAVASKRRKSLNVC